MKKHNESKSTMGYRHSKGKALYKVTIFTLLFVMLFCVSAYTEEKTYTVQNENGEIISVVANVTIEETTNENFHIREQTIRFNGNITIIGNPPTEYKIITNTDIIILSAEFIQNGNDIIIITYNNQNMADLISATDIIFIYNGEEFNTPGEKQQLVIGFANFVGSMIEETDYSSLIVYTENPPAYEGFIGNARGLFDMLFESIQSIFNWLVSPNVIVFFGLGIILSLTTIGILIARRFFWGR